MTSSSNVSSWFINLVKEDEERASYTTCVMVDEAFLRAFRSTSFRIRTREQLRSSNSSSSSCCTATSSRNTSTDTCHDGRQWNHQSQQQQQQKQPQGTEEGEEEGDGKAHHANTATTSAAPTTSTTSGDGELVAPAAAPTTTSSTCTESTTVPVKTSANDDNTALPDKTKKNTLAVALNTNDIVQSITVNSPTIKNVNQCIHYLLSNLIVTFCGIDTNSTIPGDRDATFCNSSSRKLLFSSAVLKDTQRFFTVINTILKEEHPSLQFLDPQTTWPHWYNGNDGKVVLPNNNNNNNNNKAGSITERKFILHILALMDMNVRSAHRQRLLVASNQTTANTQRQQLHRCTLYEYLDFMDNHKNMKQKEATPVLLNHHYNSTNSTNKNYNRNSCTSHSKHHSSVKHGSNKEEEEDNMITTNNTYNTTNKTNTKPTANKTNNKRKKKSKKRHTTTKPTMEESSPTETTTLQCNPCRNRTADNHSNDTTTLNNSSNDTSNECCCNSSILASVYSNKENGENVGSSEASSSLRPSSSSNAAKTSSSGHHPLAEVIISSSSSSSSCSLQQQQQHKPTVEQPTKPKTSTSCNSRNNTNIEESTTTNSTEEVWTVVSRKNSSNSLSQLKVKVIAATTAPPTLNRSYQQQSSQPSCEPIPISSSNLSSSSSLSNATTNTKEVVVVLPSLSSSMSSSPSSLPIIPNEEEEEEPASATNAHTADKLPFSAVIAPAVASATPLKGNNNMISQAKQQIAPSTEVVSSTYNIGNEGELETENHSQTCKPLAETESSSSRAFSKKNHQTGKSHGHNRNSSYSIHLTVRQAPTSPKNYHPPSYLSMQRQQSGGGSSTNADHRSSKKKNWHSNSNKLMLPTMSDQQNQNILNDPNDVAQLRSSTTTDEPSVPVPIFLGMESNSASSSVSSSLDGPSGSVPRLHHQDERRKARRNAKITEEGYHLLKSCKKLSADIDVFMKRRSAALGCRRKERRMLLAALQGTVDSIMSSTPTNGRRHCCNVEMYGSCATQLDLPSSDLDVVVRGISMIPIDTSIIFGQGCNHHYYLPPHPNAAHVMRLATELEREPWAVHIKPIPTAMVPVIKILADPSRLPGTSTTPSGDGISSNPYEVTQHSSCTGESAAIVMNQWRGADVLNGLLSVDITFEGPGHGGIGSTAFAAKVVRDACKESKLPLEKTPLVQVFMVLKELLAQRRLNEPFSGGLSSYSLLLLVCAVVKDAKNIRRSLSFLGSRKHQRHTDEVSSKDSLEEASINSTDGRMSSTMATKPSAEVARPLASKDRIHETFKTESEKETSIKVVLVKSYTATTTASSNDIGATEDLATDSTVPSCSLSFFAQAGTGSNDILEVLCRGEPTPGTLLMHFLLFYGKLFDAKTTAINVNANGSPYITRKPGGSMDPSTGMFSVDQIFIFDPLDRGEGHNVARSCFAWYSVRQVFSQCYATLVQSIESYGNGALDVNDASPLLALLLSY